MKARTDKHWRWRGALIALLCVFANVASGATFTVRTTDATGEGLNDTTAFASVGGNTATTLGEARMNVLREAARVWGTLIQSDVTIIVDAAFDPLTCSTLSGTLGSAGPRSLYRNFSAGVSPDVYYVSALANALAGRKLASQTTSADITATFNSALDSDINCLSGRGFYYGFDHNRGTRIDLLLVVLHELGHGLGFTSDVDLTTGKGIIGSDSVERFSSYTQNIFDEQMGKAWPAMTDAERLQSAAHTGSVAWNGSAVNAQLSHFTAGGTSAGRFRLNAPATISPGSSISHWDPVVTPSVLMEPNLPSTITTSSTDITVCAFQDIGWTVTVCPHNAANRTPAANAQTVNGTEDIPITITLTGSDADNDPLTFLVTTPPLKGSLSIIATTTPHTVIYTPNANANGSDSFSFAVNDGVTTSANAVVNINLAAINDPPTAGAIAVNVQSGQSTSIVLLGSDIDGDALNYAIIGNPSHGSVSGAGANISYRPVDGFSGTDAFTYQVNDGLASSSPATVTITVLAASQVNTTSSGSSGGGGALNYALMLLLTTIVLARQLRAPTNHIGR